MNPVKWGVAALVAAALVGLPVAAPAQDDYQYQKRARRYEGIKSFPVSGFDIDLLSVRADYQDRPDALGERLRVRFFLDQPRPVHLVVREINNRHYYWLDRAEPVSPWTAGFGNVFDWPTADVLASLRGLKPYDLGVVARLDRREPGAVETVAPAILYQSQAPAEIKGYLFTFNLRDDAKLKAVIYREPTDTPVFTQNLDVQSGGRPFTLKWSVSSATPGGPYKLVVSGHVRKSNDPLSQVVRFQHQPAVR